MQDILNDIELDVAELKCLLQVFPAETDPRLTAVAERSIERLKQRLDELKQSLHQPASPADRPQTAATPTTEEAEAAPLPQEDEDTRPAKEPVHEAAPAGSSPILAERIRPAGGLRHALSLNDSFHFARELFGGDTSALNALLARMDDAHCLEEASLLFVQAIHVPEDTPAVPEFEELLKKYFEP